VNNIVAASELELGCPPRFKNTPQHAEAPPNAEVKRIISCCFAVLFYESKHLFLNSESKIMVLFRVLAGYLLFSCYYTL